MMQKLKTYLNTSLTLALTLLAVCLVSSQSWAQADMTSLLSNILLQPLPVPQTPYQEKNTEGTEEQQSLAFQLSEALKPHVKVISHPIQVYHWVKRSNVTKNEVDFIKAFGADTRNYVTMMSKQFNDSVSSGVLEKKQSDVMGDGFYLARDPISTRYYGGDASEWALIQLALKTNTRFIDVTDPKTNYIKGSIGKDLRAINCLNDVHSMLSRNTANENIHCRLIIAMALELLKVDFFSYPLKGLDYVHTPYCLNNQYNQAFVLISERNIEWSETFILTKDLAPDADTYYQKKRDMILYLWALNQNKIAKGPFAPPPAYSLPPSIQEVQDYVQSSLFMCSNEAL